RRGPREGSWGRGGETGGGAFRLCVWGGKGVLEGWTNPRRGWPGTRRGGNPPRVPAPPLGSTRHFSAPVAASIATTFIVGVVAYRTPSTTTAWLCISEPLNAS